MKSEPCGGGEPSPGEALQLHPTFRSCWCLQMQSWALRHPKDVGYHGDGFEAGRAIALAQGSLFPVVEPGGRASGGIPVCAACWGGELCSLSSDAPGCSWGSRQSHEGPVAFKILSWVFDMTAGGHVKWTDHHAEPVRLPFHERLRPRCLPRQFLKS